MSLPPRPPIICYDLQTNCNPRRTLCAKPRPPLVGASRGNQVTVVQREANELESVKSAHLRRPQSSSNSQITERRHNFNLNQRSDPENLPLRRPTRRLVSFAETVQKPKLQTQQHAPRDYIVRLPRQKTLTQSEPYQFNTHPFGGQPCLATRPFDHHNARKAYDQKMKLETEERERWKENRQRRLAGQAQLDDLTDQLKSLKRVQEYLLRTCGMGHNAAKYIQQQDEDIVKLEKKVDEFSQVRAREMSRQVQQMKRFQELHRDDDRKSEDKRFKDMSKITHCKRTLSSTLNNSLSSNSPTNNTTTTTNTASSSSTISLSSCSSPMSTNEPLHSINYAKPPPIAAVKSTRATTQTSKLQTSRLQISNILSSSTPRSRRNNTNVSIMSPKTVDKFSFYKRNGLEETIEVTDLDFFEKVEDKTMLEVNELVFRMKSELNH